MMYACLHRTGLPQTTHSDADELLSLAYEFSPAVEQTTPDTVVFSITPLRKLLGSPHQIASEICRFGYERKLQANLAIAANPDTAILLARNSIGVTLVTPGEEHLKLAPFPLTCLFAHDIPVDPGIAQIFHRWGLKTCEDLALLPAKGVEERLGKAGVYLRNLACGRIHRPLRLSNAETDYEERVELEHPLSLLEPLLFLFARVLNGLCGRLRSQSRAARLLEVKLDLEAAQAAGREKRSGESVVRVSSIAAQAAGRGPETEKEPRLREKRSGESVVRVSSIEQKTYRCELEFPVPLDDHASILKLLQLHLERHSPEAPIVAFSLRIEPAEPRRVQSNFFVPPTPLPDKLQITLERIAGMVGKENVGTPNLLNTHRPDAFETTPHLGFEFSKPLKQCGFSTTDLRLVMRLFRPALEARVVVVQCTPKYVAATGVKGNVIETAGPWKTSGEWWAATAWTHEEWDVALDDGALYRIYQQPERQAWYVSGVYD